MTTCISSTRAPRLVLRLLLRLLRLPVPLRSALLLAPVMALLVPALVPAGGGGPVAAGAVAAGRGTVVRTDGGLVRGTAAADGYRSFQGIPYAAPPVGPLRWRPPLPARPWHGTRDATRPGDRCAQNADPLTGTARSTSEDCLYLNVAVPPRRPGERLPVLVWIHGGGLSSGAGSDQDPRRLAADGHVIVVTVNYRLGVFGFFGHSGLPGSGDFGIMDQRAALAWVGRNAARFGGDGHEVTVFGESGGGDSVCAQLASPAARGLFARAAIQSGTCTDTNAVDDLYPGAGAATATWKPLDAVRSAGAGVAERLGCKERALPCLRAMSAEQLLSAPAVAAVYWSPAYGTPTLPRSPGRAIAAGDFAHVPVLEGTTRDEATLLVAAALGQIGTGTLHDLLDRALGPRAGEVAAAYPASRYGSPSLRWAAIVTDRAYACPNQRTEAVLASQVPTHAYEFADTHAPSTFDMEPPFPLGAYHGSDLPYVWDVPGRTALLSPAQRRLSGQMIRYLARFAATGDPNRPGLPHWPAVRGPAPVLQRLAPPSDGGVHPATTAALHHCDLWD
ncbi:carboxylesterase/lipase family protein [Streptomyces sp. TS71-3]|uniref:carboxylesterase/lipase family protein n=1 Tax=Streptomyces sp. TS71-3 TaxID=2733862 RepID=UPI001B0EDC2D|nr:carboxylesterase family protein [Streptomyces sp. TS71-3]GHJ36184.1 carboxylic ester hydrolase [Streptomyces sp. TS71-3]